MHSSGPLFSKSPGRIFSRRPGDLRSVRTRDVVELLEVEPAASPREPRNCCGPASMPHFPGHAYPLVSRLRDGWAGWSEAVSASEAPEEATVSSCRVRTVFGEVRGLFGGAALASGGPRTTLTAVLSGSDRR